MSRRGFDHERGIEREGAAVAMIILLPDRTDALDVLGLAAGQISFINGHVNARDYKYCHWNLRKDDLAKQSDECISFIAALLTA
jgi:hypothetical protein